jgi:hypothetical protein
MVNRADSCGADRLANKGCSELGRLVEELEVLECTPRVVLHAGVETKWPTLILSSKSGYRLGREQKPFSTLHFRLEILKAFLNFDHPVTVISFEFRLSEGGCLDGLVEDLVEGIPSAMIDGGEQNL